MDLRQRRSSLEVGGEEKKAKRLPHHGEVPHREASGHQKLNDFLFGGQRTWVALMGGKGYDFKEGPNAEEDLGKRRKENI